MRKSYSKLSIKKEEVAQEPSKPVTRHASKHPSKFGKLFIKSENTTPRPEYKKEDLIKDESNSKVKLEGKCRKVSLANFVSQRANQGRRISVSQEGTCSQEGTYSQEGAKGSWQEAHPQIDEGKQIPRC